MGSIGDGAPGLEMRGAKFTVESLAKELPQDGSKRRCGNRDANPSACGFCRRRSRCGGAILMGLHRRTSYVNLLEKLHGTWWTRERRSPEKPPCSGAVTKARDRIGIKPMEILFKRAAAEWFARTEGLVIHGLRVQAVDGSTMKTPDTPKNVRRFGRPGSSRGRGNDT